MVYGYKTLVEEGTGHILGAHLVGPNVDEVINLFGLAIRHGLTAEQLKTTIFAYPTGASDVGYTLWRCSDDRDAARRSFGCKPRTGGKIAIVPSGTGIQTWRPGGAAHWEPE